MKNQKTYAMAPLQLEGWLARRKKCAPMKNKKAYSRKTKHKQKIFCEESKQERNLKFN